MHSLGIIRLSGFTGFTFPARTTCVNGAAAAGAMLICGAIVCNVGPFAKPSKAGAQVPLATYVFDETVGPSPITRRVAPHAPRLARWVAKPEGAPQPVTTSVQAMPDTVATPAGAPLVLASDAAASPNPDRGAADKSTVVGVWAPDAGTCSARVFKDGTLPTVINAEGAWAGETFCIFTKRTETDNGWRVVAKCSTPRESWTSLVRLTVHDNRLIWTSQRGTQTYSRCRPDLLVAQAR